MAWGSKLLWCKSLRASLQQLEATIRAESYEEAEGLYQQLLQVAEITKQAAEKIIVS